jgi:hypothetical protein
MIIGEWGTVDQGGSKAGWVADALSNEIPENYKRIRAVVSCDYTDGKHDWKVDTTQAAREAFQAAITAPYYMANIYGGQTKSPIPVP